MVEVLLGRFQPLHNGHKKLIDKLKSEKDDLMVLIGSADKAGSRENPLSFEQRKQLIKSCFPDLKVEGVEDTEFTEKGNREWRKRIIERFNPDVIISGNDLVHEIFEESNIEVEDPEMFNPDLYSGSVVRRRMRSGEEWRYLVPNCAEDLLKDFQEQVEEAGPDYEFEPGWNPENFR